MTEDKDKSPAPPTPLGEGVTGGSGSFLTLLEAVARLVPENMRNYYYQRMAYFRTLNPDDELLRITEAMGFLSLIIRDAPIAMARERKALERLLRRYRWRLTWQLGTVMIGGSLALGFSLGWLVARQDDALNVARHAGMTVAIGSSEKNVKIIIGGYDEKIDEPNGGTGFVKHTDPAQK